MKFHRVKMQFLALVLVLSMFSNPFCVFAASESANQLQEGAPEIVVKDPVEIGELQEEELPLLEPFSLEDGEWQISSVTMTEISGPEQVYDSGAFLARAADTDIVASNLRVAPGSPAQPFPGKSTITFLCNVRNNGSTTVTGVNFYFYVDNELKLVQAAGTMAAKTTYEISLNVVGGYGRHSIKFSFNDNRMVTETNYDNNGVAGFFAWLDSPVIYAAYIRKESGPDTFEIRQQINIEFSIANSGSVPVTATPYKIYLKESTGSSLLYQNFCPAIGSKRRMVMTLPITFNQTGDYTLILEAGTPPEGDDTPDDNVASSPVYHVTPDTELWAGSWGDASNIQVVVTPSAMKYLEGKGITFSMASSYIRGWNGISSNVRYTVSKGTAESESEQKENYVYLRVEEDYSSESTLGITYNYAYFDDGMMWAVSDSIIEDYECEYVSSEVVLITSHLVDAEESKIAHIIRHEFGHVLGLKHPECTEKAVMAAYIDRENASPTIVEHDKYNVRRKYGT